MIAANATAKAAPDGYTLMQATSGTMAMNATIFKNLAYDPDKDLVPVALHRRRSVHPGGPSVAAV